MNSLSKDSTKEPALSQPAACCNHLYLTALHPKALSQTVNKGLERTIMGESTTKQPSSAHPCTAFPSH